MGGDYGRIRLGNSRQVKLSSTHIPRWRKFRTEKRPVKQITSETVVWIAHQKINMEQTNLSGSNKLALISIVIVVKELLEDKSNKSNSYMDTDFAAVMSVSR